MCSIGDSFNIDIKEDIKVGEYVCKDCGKFVDKKHEQKGGRPKKEVKQEDDKKEVGGSTR